MGAAVRVTDLRFAWSAAQPPIEFPDLEIAQGERVLLSGPSGAGKSTLIALLTGVATAQHGTVEILGQDLAQLSPGARDRFRGRSIGLIFQAFNLIPYMSMVDNVTLPRLCGRTSGGDDRAEADRLLRALGLEDKALRNRPVSTLSHGQQQRVAAARALFGRPGLLIADEPTSALDADSRDLFLALLTTECRATGTAFAIASHEAAVAQHVDRIWTIGAR